MLAPDSAAPNPDSPPASSCAGLALTGTPIVATARLGAGDTLLGTTTDALFDQVNGQTIFAPRTDGTGRPAQTPVDQITFGWVQAETIKDLAANISGWGLASAALNTDNTTRYMSMRAYQIDYYEDVDLTMCKQVAQPSAVYFVSKIYYGHSYESLFSGDQSTFTAAVAATLPRASGSITATATSDNLTATNVGRGLVPNNGSAVFAMSSADVTNNYTANGPSVPIYVEYRLVPSVTEPSSTQIRWASATDATISIDEIDVFHNGSFLDLSNTAWTLSVTCSVNSAIVQQNLPLWTDNSVTAGGTSVDRDGVTPPQDPNAGDSTSTYGRFANLPFRTVIPVSSGNTLACNLSGTRTDTSPPVALPPVSFAVKVDGTTATSGYVGNYDTGTDLDYAVHYSIAY
jgi:hypothetical protein